MKLGIILLSWNDPEDTLGCIRQVAKWRPPDSLICVVDNGSSPPFDPSGTDVAVVRNEQNLGFAGGVNCALRDEAVKACGAVLLLNTDTTFPHRDAAELLAQFAAHPEVAAMSPSLCESSGTNQVIYHGARSISRHIATRQRAVTHGGVTESVVPVDFLSGTAFLCRTSALQQVGLFDERYFFSGEISDLCQRMNKAGLTCAICTSAQIQHDLGTKGHQRSTIHNYYSLRNRFLFVRKHEALGMRFLFLIAWIALGMSMAAKATVAGGGGSQQGAAMLCAVRDGLLGRYGRRRTGH
jgi:GT2 family glycosyltransferase